MLLKERTALGSPAIPDKPAGGCDEGALTCELANMSGLAIMPGTTPGMPGIIPGNIAI